MKNVMADGIAEDLIRSFVQVGCAEVHEKTLYEKQYGEIENGVHIDITDADVVRAELDKLDRIRDEINTLAELRRSIMKKLFELYDGDNAYWCVVKHLGIGAYTLFEAYESSDNDAGLCELAIDANKAFITALSSFLGTEVTDCAACFADFLKAKEV